MITLPLNERNAILLPALRVYVHLIILNRLHTIYKCTSYEFTVYSTFINSTYVSLLFAILTAGIKINMHNCTLSL